MQMSNCLTGSYQQFDKEGSGVAEMNVTEVISVLKESPDSFSIFSVILTLILTLPVAFPDNVWMRKRCYWRNSVKVQTTANRDPEDPAALVTC